jgi:hypothetical protein
VKQIWRKTKREIGAASFIHLKKYLYCYPSSFILKLADLSIDRIGERNALSKPHGHIYMEHRLSRRNVLLFRRRSPETPASTGEPA